MWSIHKEWDRVREKGKINSAIESIIRDGRRMIIYKYYLTFILFIYFILSCFILSYFYFYFILLRFAYQLYTTMYLYICTTNISIICWPDVDKRYRDVYIMKYHWRSNINVVSCFISMVVSSCWYQIHEISTLLEKTVMLFPYLNKHAITISYILSHCSFIFFIFCLRNYQYSTWLITRYFSFIFNC